MGKYLVPWEIDATKGPTNCKAIAMGVAVLLLRILFILI